MDRDGLRKGGAGLKQRLRFAGKVALITGAGRGIGREVAIAFAREGASVIVNYHRAETGARAVVEVIAALGGKALAVQADVSQGVQVEAMVERALAEFDHIDILVNNAGVFSQTKLFDVTEERWDQILAVNLKSVFLCSQATARSMLQRGSGCIINMASGVGVAPNPRYDVSVAYAASKAGVVRLTQRLAIELAPHVRVNCIVPGFIDSKPERTPDDVRQRFAELAPLKRVGRPAEVAAAILFLASDESSFITGQALAVDGGLAMT